MKITYLELENNSGFFQKISIKISRSQFPSYPKMNSNKFTKSGRVIVTSSFGISKSLHGRVSRNNLIFKSTTTLKTWLLSSATTGTVTCSNNGKILNYSLFFRLNCKKFINFFGLYLSFENILFNFIVNY